MLSRLLVVVTYKRVLDWMIVFIDTQLVTKSNYSAIAIYTLYRSLLHTLVSSVFTSRVLTTDLYSYKSLSVTATHYGN
jgi:hypothetical protein